ncbi:Fic family protein [Asticcacaulis solisilvae]|uniref:Fic family protein n=1 Tax=Asticcacaulis solisilvae TaxID=1217274 RepID=UPI003FD71F61
MYNVEAALVAASPDFFRQHPVEARTLLSMQPNAQALLARLLNGGHTRAAGRLAGAFTNIGRAREASAIVTGMAAADHVVTETDPFTDTVGRIPYRREPSPYVQRIRLMWQTLRTAIIGAMPAPASPRLDIEAYMKQVEDTYVSDAYHSLSIEGYQVSAELIERVRSGAWNPQDDEVARNERNALAARGYWQAFQAVKASLRRVLAGENPGDVANDDHGIWYQQLFQPSVAAGLIKPESLAGYRTSPVYIRGSMHVPLKSEAVPDAMSIFFELLAEEAEPAVRVVLGHFVYVYIHPYIDGNGRTGRFLMNVMLAAAGYPWLVIPVQERAGYMAALESASVAQDIRPFATFLADLVFTPNPPAG